MDTSNTTTLVNKTCLKHKQNFLQFKATVVTNRTSQMSHNTCKQRTQVTKMTLDEMCCTIKLL